MSRKTIPYSQWSGLKTDGASWVRQCLKEKQSEENAAKKKLAAQKRPRKPIPWIERIRQESAHIRTLELPALLDLPCESPDWGAGIYFLWLSGQLQYIGKSTCICNRIYEHERREAMRFDRYTCLLLNAGPNEFRDMSIELRDHERAYIARYPTPYNSRYFTPGT